MVAAVGHNAARRGTSRHVAAANSDTHGTKHFQSLPNPLQAFPAARAHIPGARVQIRGAALAAVAARWRTTKLKRTSLCPTGARCWRSHGP